MNMILHGIEAPNIIHTNTLSENIRDIQEKDRYDIILANPPFGGKERKEVQQNFDIKTGETAFLFLQHFIKSLRTGGRSAIVIKNTFLSNTDNASISLRKYLLESCNLYAILAMPSGTFLGAGVKTVVLFFNKGEPAKKIWYYQFNPGRNLGKTNPLNDKDLEEFIELQKSQPESEKSWTLDINEIPDETIDLSVRNPNTPEEKPLRKPEEILSEIKKLDTENTRASKFNKQTIMRLKSSWRSKKLGDLFTIERGGSPRPIKNYITTDDSGYNWIKISDATASGKYITKNKTEDYQGRPA